MKENPSLLKIAALFFKLGCLGFGGPLAHIALMDQECVRRRQWLSRSDFLEMLAATQLIPGPNSTEMALHIGYRAGGLPGLLTAGCAFIFPAFSASVALAWAYLHWGQLPFSQDLLQHVRPIILAIIIHALWGFARQLPRRVPLLLGGSLALGLHLLGVHELLSLLAVGFAFVCYDRRQSSSMTGAALFAATPFSGFSWSLAPAWAQVFLIFLKTGSILYGSGYTLLLYLRHDFVTQRAWLSEAQLLDAITVGQLTPGPLFSSASFIGYILAGGAGAIAATVGIFLPAFLLVAAGSWLFPRLRKLSWTRSLLEGVNAAALGLMVIVLVELAPLSLTGPLNVLLFCSSFLLVARTSCDPAWLIAGGLGVGLGRWWLTTM